MNPPTNSPIPVTVFTGYLGSGKTTIILNLIKQLDPSYQIVWLKNEYGNVSIDSELASEQNIKVAEMLNGCLCCVLVGKLGNAVREILQKYHPNRIIIESSGTAYPLPIALELGKIPEVKLDGIVNVIDALNFGGYEDKGRVAEMQAEATDLILMNKVELVDQATLDKVLDDVYELNPSTPKLNTNKGWIALDVIFGLDSSLESYQAQPGTEHEHDHGAGHHPDEVDVIELVGDYVFDAIALGQYLEKLKKHDFIRIKGVINTPDGAQLLNWVFGRLDLQELSEYTGPSKLVLMGKGVERMRSQVLQELSDLAMH